MKFYWNKYYRLKKSPLLPSNFAKYCKKKYLKKNKSLLEIGCGNGRDAFFFYKNNLNVTAIDKSESIIKKNKKKNDNINFKKIDVDNKKFFLLGKFNYIYARFFLHTINLNSQNKLFENIVKLSFNRSTLIMLEFRTINDPLFSKGKKISKYERMTDHYRRFIDKDVFKKYLVKNNFKILNIIEKKGLAKYKKDNPVVCRIIFRIDK